MQYVVVARGSLLLALMAGCEVALADDPAWSVTTPNSSNTNSGLHGTEFTPTNNITVTALGYYDDTFSGPDGLASAHQVGIYNIATQQLLVSGTVPAGIGTTKIGHFRYINVPATGLTAGTAYVVVAVANGDNGRNVTPGSSMTTDARIATASWRTGLSGGLSFPGTVLTTATRFMGPSFLFTSPPAPPPPGQIAFTIPAAFEANSGSGVNGTQFMPPGAIMITGLGYYDDVFAGADGLLASHQVALYLNGNATPLVSATVPAGPRHRRSISSGLCL